MSQKTDQWWEKKLGIETGPVADRFIDDSCNPYEPTDYCILERLAESGYITADSHILDYGCGLGRSLFFMAARTGCKATGIDYDPQLIEMAERNLARAKLPAERKAGIRFICADARSYKVREENCFYFFNPFSDEILRVVLEQIKRSYYEDPRRMHLFFYYPFDSGVVSAMADSGLRFAEEIDCMDLYDLFDSRERILVFEAG